MGRKPSAKKRMSPPSSSHKSPRDKWRMCFTRTSLCALAERICACATEGPDYRLAHRIMIKKARGNDWYYFATRALWIWARIRLENATMEEVIKDGARGRKELNAIRRHVRETLGTRDFCRNKETYETTHFTEEMEIMKYASFSFKDLLSLRGIAVDIMKSEEGAFGSNISLHVMGDEDDEPKEDIKSKTVPFDLEEDDSYTPVHITAITVSREVETLYPHDGDAVASITILPNTVQDEEDDISWEAARTHEGIHSPGHNLTKTDLRVENSPKPRGGENVDHGCVLLGTRQEDDDDDRSRVAVQTPEDEHMYPDMGACLTPHAQYGDKLAVCPGEDTEVTIVAVNNRRSTRLFEMQVPYVGDDVDDAEGVLESVNADPNVLSEDENEGGAIQDDLEAIKHALGSLSGDILPATSTSATDEYDAEKMQVACVAIPRIESMMNTPHFSAAVTCVEEGTNFCKLPAATVTWDTLKTDKNGEMIDKQEQQPLLGGEDMLLADIINGNGQYITVPVQTMAHAFYEPHIHAIYTEQQQHLPTWGLNNPMTTHDENVMSVATAANDVEAPNAQTDSELGNKLHGASVRRGRKPTSAPNASTVPLLHPPRATTMEKGKEKVSPHQGGQPNAWETRSSKIFQKVSQGGTLHYIKPKDPHKMRVDLAKTMSKFDAWGWALLGHYVGYAPTDYMLKNLIRAWGVQAKYTIEAGWIVFRFKTEEDMDHVLKGSPHHIYNKPLILKKMPDFFAFNKSAMASIPIWVRIYGLAKECWTSALLSEAASYIGVPMFKDRITEEGSKDTYARVMVERETTTYRRHFRFYNMWTLHPDFIEIVRQGWQTDVTGYQQYRLVRLLSGMKGVLKSLNRTEFSRISTRASDAARAYSDGLDYYRLLPDDQVNRGHIEALRKRATWLSRAEYSFLSQQAKAKYILESDRCTRFFHSLMRANGRRSHIASIDRPDGSRTTTMDGVVSEFVGYYQGILGTAPPTEIPDTSLIAPGPTITEEQSMVLTSPITCDEIRGALWAIGDEKSPGPDGYGARFFKASWEITGPMVCEAVSEFFDSGKLLKQLNHTIIAPIAKVESPTTVSQFRPISCCNVVYKIISKVMAIRLRSCLGTLIDDAQNAFVDGRQMTDNIFLLQELLRRYLIKRETRKCCLNIDIAKAYDTVSWGFLRFALTHLGFPDQFVRWIMICVTTVSYSVRVNKDIHGFFKGKRGLRQGDPLSALLFVICIEILSRMIRLSTSTLGFNYHQFCEGPKLTHLVFADDIVLFSRGDIGSVQILMDCLRCYGRYSGLIVNCDKSAIFLGSVPDGQDGDEDEATEIIAATGFPIGSFPFRYLGIPVGPQQLEEFDYAPMLARVSGYLSIWAKRNLSFAGRKELITSVIQGVEGFWLSVLTPPVVVIQKLIRLCRNFLWNCPRVSWRRLCDSKEEGGLGLRDLTLWNRCFMLKHLWRLVEAKDSLWIRWVHHRYWEETHRHTRRDALSWQSHPRDSPLIKGILKARGMIERIDRGGLLVREMLESWCEGGKFSVSLAYAALRQKQPVVTWAREVWPKHGTPKHCFMLWLATLQRLPTYDRMHFLDVDPTCRLCQGTVETHDHLFFSCPTSALVWSTVCRKFGIPTTIDTIASALTWLRAHARPTSCLGRARLLALSATVYTIWHVRNATIFERNPIPAERMIWLVTAHVYRLLYARHTIEEVMAI